MNPSHSATPHRELNNSISRFLLPMIFLFGIVAVMLQLMPIYFQSIGVSESGVQLLFLIPPLITIGANQFWGYLADLHMNTRMAIIIMSVGSIFVSLAFPFFQSYLALCVLMVVMTFFSNARVPMINTLILNSTNGEARYGVVRTIGSAAFVVIGFVASVLVDRFPDGGLGGIFALLAICNLGIAISMLPIRDFPVSSARKNRQSFWVEFSAVQKKLMERKIVRSFFMFIFLSQVFIVPSLLGQIMYIKSPEFVAGSTTDSSVALGIGAAAEIVVFLLFPKIIKHVRLMPLMLIAFIFNPLRWVLVYATTTVEVIWVTNLFHALTYGLMYMCSVIFVNRELPLELRNSAQTLLGLVFAGISIIIGQLISAVYLLYFDVRSWFLVVAFLSFLPFPFWLRMAREYQREHKVHGFWVTKPVPDYKG